MSDMLNRRFIPCHLLLNWNISAFSTCWNGLDQHKMDKLYRGWKNYDWRSWKNPNEYEKEGSEWRELSGVLKLLRSEFCIWERNSSTNWLVNKVRENSKFFLQRMINFQALCKIKFMFQNLYHGWIVQIGFLRLNISGLKWLRKSWDMDKCFF